jgi:hypothetical protein
MTSKDLVTVARQPSVFFAVTVYDPGAETAIAWVVAPVLHW